MPLPIIPFSRDDVEIIERCCGFQGFFKLDTVHLRHRLHEGGWGAEIQRELFVRGPAVGVVLYDPVHDLIGLVEQFRIGALDDEQGPWCMEIVAGIAESGESLDEVAFREVQEETGLQPGSLEYICHYLSSPGGCDEKLHLFCARVNLQGAGGIFGLAREGEDIAFHVLEAEAVFNQLYDGRFNNAATLIGLQWLQTQRPRMRDLAPETES